MKLHFPFVMALIGLVAGETLRLQAGDSSQSAALQAGESEGWKLVWSDEFDKDGPPDPRNWTYEEGFVRGRELQWYQSDNAVCQQGLLIIEGRLERKRNPNYVANSDLWRKKREYAEYTSASITTKGLHSWLYGRFQMRARINTSPGLHPCFWTLGLQGQWPNCGEIDIMEYHRGWLLANAAWSSKTNGVAQWNMVRTRLKDFQNPEWAHNFHLWQMDWDPTSIRLFVDDVLLNTIDLTKTSNQSGDDNNPFHQPHYLILDLAIGRKPDDDPAQTKFPARFEVDYVRVYQKQPGPPSVAAGPLANADKPHR